MARTESEPRALQTAQAVVRRYGLGAPSDIDLEAICWGEGLLATEGPIHAADAWLVVKAGRGLARVRESIPYAGQKRFALAHELGHWLMHRQDDATFYDDSVTLASYQRDPRELEASQFASELLVPDDLLRQRHRSPVSRLEYGLEIASEFTVGPFVAMRKLLTLAGVNALLVVSDGNTTLYHKRSQRCTLYSPPAKRTVPQGPTREACKCPGKIVAAKVDAHGWSEKAHAGAPWFEQAFRPDEDSPVLTLLTWGKGV